MKKCRKSGSQSVDIEAKSKQGFFYIIYNVKQNWFPQICVLYQKWLKEQ